MKFKVLFLLTIVLMLSFQANAQRGVRIGYIDTEYILENVPEYSQATQQLESKVQTWKQDIEKKLKGIEQKRTVLNNEKALLTKELIEEREEDIFFEEKEILDYQQKRFGPGGDLMIQKRQLMQPVQDQIFQAVQDIAAAKKYDFVFDKSAGDVVMLYSAERFDISEQVLRTITRSSKRKQLKSKKERKEVEEEDVTVEIDDSKDARQEALDKKKADRAALVEARKKEIADKRAAAIAAREKLKQDKLDARNKGKEEAKEKTDDAQGIEDDKVESTDDNKAENKEEAPKTREEILQERREKKLADRAARKKELDARRQKIIEDRKKAKEQKESTEDDENADE